ncbi:uncharacterized protein N0V89_006042 [Didymosphaeria variabile]|uniref:Protein kinase domain-containing protein n=1 Tax=Didymosphaeria variabile TaxID=1932322 RepID=A0A9W9CCB0_9PLEO|nr:uncharacterized protein N0V89_006042 [Didymosphaeria variabile]KAJ4354308.1 hypothetical protein N0V89_006042 [Didymosphaeria variabile]
MESTSASSLNSWDQALQTFSRRKIPETADSQLHGLRILRSSSSQLSIVFTNEVSDMEVRMNRWTEHVHTRNIVIKDDRWDRISEAELLSNLGKPETAEIVSEESSDPNLPRYLVRPSTFRVTNNKAPDIRLIDFGEAFTKANKPQTLHTPLALRAPEVLFEDEWDHRVDLWSAGCTIFELLTGQPPFDTIMTTKDILIGQMVEEVGPLPDRWTDRWQAKDSDGDDENYSLEEWLLELYLDKGKEAELTREQLGMWADVIKSLMRFEPGKRVSASRILQYSCFS